MGRAEDLFAQIKKRGEHTIDELIADAQAENLWLDFKRAGNDGKGSKLSDSDWKNYAKALSGFANSDGGVVLWGVACASDPVLGDVPTGKVPIENPARFVSWLENAASACTVPAVPNAEHFAFESSSNAGFVATLIPSSGVAPHQCIRPTGTLAYYIRAGSNFMQTPHAVLAGMFGRRPQPEVFHTYRCSSAIDKVGARMTLKMDVFVHLYSKGPGIARDAFMHILMGVPGGGSKGSFELEPNGTGNWETQVEFDDVLASAVAKEHYRVPPHMFVRVFRLRLDLVEPFTSAYGLRITSGCDGAPLHVADTGYEPDEMQQKYQAALALLLKDKSANQDAVAGLFLP